MFPRLHYSILVSRHSLGVDSHFYLAHGSLTSFLQLFSYDKSAPRAISVIGTARHSS